MPNRTFHGVVRGKTIELSEDPGVPVGQAVEVLVLLSPSAGQKWGDGLRRCAGALSDGWTDEDDRILEAIHLERKHDGRPELSV